jgi:hypothetical protein
MCLCVSDLDEAVEEHVLEPAQHTTTTPGNLR